MSTANDMEILRNLAQEILEKENDRKLISAEIRDLKRDRDKILLADPNQMTLSDTATPITAKAARR